MLPLQSLLNPAPPNGRSACPRQPARGARSPPSTDAAARGAMDAPPTPQRPAPRSTAPLLKAKTQGPVRFPPFEAVDEGAAREVARYQIASFGRIQQCCEHIPYNSTKKDFFEKTGRESIEAFKYEFRVPGQHSAYKVMWDYNIGLVRMTPFFKCLGYPKTKPSQMLDKNPGLREISPSITGGSVSAQGYWMPYRCARAVCATFCFEIAGALIPLFGPDFPSECTRPESQFFGEMVINHQLVVEATLEANASRHAYGMRKITALNGPASQGRLEGCAPQRPLRSEGVLAYLRQPSRSLPSWAPYVGAHGYHLAPHPGLVSRGGVDAHPHGGSGHTLPPMLNLPKRESQTLQLMRNAHDGVPQTRVLTAPRVATDSWVFKRRRGDHEHSDDACARARPKAARLGRDAALQEGEDGTRERGARRQAPRSRGGEDYAAAAVLVRLQSKDHEASATAAGPVSGSSSRAPAPGLGRSTMRHRASSL